jgi:hypothetical protein
VIRRERPLIQQRYYAAFTWNVGDQSSGSLSLIANYDGTPHERNGTFYSAQLLAFNAGSSVPPMP